MHIPFLKTSSNCFCSVIFWCTSKIASFCNCVWSVSLARRLWTTFVLSRQSMQLVRNTPDWVLIICPPDCWWKNLWKNNWKTLWKYYACMIINILCFIIQEDLNWKWFLNKKCGVINFDQTLYYCVMASVNFLLVKTEFLAH